MINLINVPPCRTIKYRVHDAWWICWKLSFHTANDNDDEAEKMPPDYLSALKEIAILRYEVNDLLDEWEKQQRDIK
jgi:hypothetical protein